jgi:hypothetical protein
VHVVKIEYKFRTDNVFATFTYFVDDWRFDGYRWRQIGKSQMPKKAPVVIKYHYHLTTPDGLCKQFRKFVYTHIREESSAKVVIHYIGDSNLATNFPHGMGHVSSLCNINCCFSFAHSLHTVCGRQ